MCLSIFIPFYLQRKLYLKKIFKKHELAVVTVKIISFWRECKKYTSSYIMNFLVNFYTKSCKS